MIGFYRISSPNWQCGKTLDEEKLLSNNFNESSRLAPLSGHENKSQISSGADNESINNLTKNVQLLMSE